MDFARTTRAALTAAMIGLCLFLVSCDNDDGDGGDGTLIRARQAERMLLERVDIAPGALVSFVGPVPPGSALIPVENSTPGITVPPASGVYYLFFINDSPDVRYVHDVRYAWLEYEHGGFEVIPQEWWPRLELPGVNRIEPFHLLFSNSVGGVDFYYGSGGNDENGLPPTYMQGPGGQ